ncbi:hypothetical protein ACIQWZ_19825 [Streptomyces sp. NPDC098077]|uniref:hypothetical protein n=1 Tax=Streptomyces sp. NPDC098077 TaxID=3366093 RepID=UPI00380C0D47
MSSRWPVRRSTENAALRALDRAPRPCPDYPALFAGLVAASAARDRHGVNLLGHRIARTGGETGR